MSQIRLYEYMFQMWRIDLYALCIRTFNHIWNMYSYNRIWEIAVIFSFHFILFHCKFTSCFNACFHFVYEIFNVLFCNVLAVKFKMWNGVKHLLNLYMMSNIILMLSFNFTILSDWKRIRNNCINYIISKN